MNLKSLIKSHSDQILKLEQAIDQKKMPHAMLFTGPESIGKKMVAMALAQKLVCEKNQSACGVCPACLRMAKHQSENLLFIEPAGLNIKIDQTREISHFLSLANFGMNRLVIIDQAHLLNLQAANSILKNLEEPSDNVYFILIAPDAESVLSTIRSRSQVIRFLALPVVDMKKIKPGLADWIYKCSRGQMNELSYLSESEGLSKRLKSFELLNLFWTDPLFLQENTWRLAFKERESALHMIKNWILIMRDLIVLKMDEINHVLNSDQLESLKKLIFLNNDQLNFFIINLLRLQKDISKYMDTTLLVESLWVNHARK